MSFAARAKFVFATSTAMLALNLTVACPSRARLDAASTSALQQDYQGREYFLKQSLYFGRFYDDAARRLVDVREFSDLKQMTAPDGEIIIPPPPSGIVPAGTKVRIERIELPTSGVIFKRPLFTPRYNTWVMLKVGRYEGDVGLFHHEDYIWVVPTTYRQEEDIRAALDALLSQEDLQPWLNKRSAVARAAIFEKRAEVGLSFEELIASWGHPDTLERSLEADHQVELLQYGNTHIKIVDGKITDIRHDDKNSSDVTGS
jgi:hypothetical protein